MGPQTKAKVTKAEEEEERKEEEEEEQEEIIWGVHSMGESPLKMGFEVHIGACQWNSAGVS